MRRKRIGQRPLVCRWKSPWLLLLAAACACTVLLRHHPRIIFALALAHAVVAAVFVVLWRREREQLRGLREAELERESLVRHFTSVSRGGNDIILVLNADWRIIHANEFACENLQYSRNELRRMTLNDVIAPEARAALEEQRSLLDQYQGIVFETSVLRQNGTTFPIENSVRVTAMDGTRFYQCTIRDVSDRKHAEEEHKLNESRVRALLELNQMATASWEEITHFAVEEAVRLCSSDMGYLALLGEDEFTVESLAWSDKVAPACGVPIGGRKWTLGNSGLWAEAARQRMAVVTNDYHAPNPLKMGCPEGHVRIIRHLGVPVFDGKKLVGIAGVANKETDYDESDVRELELLMAGMWQITQRKRAEDELSKQIDELGRSNEELKQFAYIASHDLKEPLRTVGNYVQLLSRRYKGKLDADADEFIHYTIDGVARMQKLIDDLLTYSRVDARMETRAPMDCEEVLDRVLLGLRAAIEESTAVISRDPLPSVMGDRRQLTQLFQNLIDNAIKFRREDPPRIHVSSADEGGHWVFSVRDNGVGIQPEFFDRIFSIFQRLHRREDYPGTGIGLAICKKIVSRHGGRIWVESKPSHGSVFYFTIPKDEGDK